MRQSVDEWILSKWVRPINKRGVDVGDGGADQKRVPASTKCVLRATYLRLQCLSLKHFPATHHIVDLANRCFKKECFESSIFDVSSARLTL